MSLNKSTTVTILRKLNMEELNEVERFLYFSLGDKSISLREAVRFFKTMAPEYAADVCTKENFSKAVFGKKLTDKLDKEINRQMSELKKEIEKYMVYKTATAEQNFTSYSQFVWYHSKGLLDEEQKILSKIETDLENKNTPDIRELYLYYLELKVMHAMVLDDIPSSYFLFQHYKKYIESKFDMEVSIAATGYVNIQSITAKYSESELKENLKNDFLKIDFSEEIKFFNAQLEFAKKQSPDLYLYLKEKLVEDKLYISNKDKGGTLAILQNNVGRVFSDFEKERLDLSAMKFDISKKLRNGAAVHYILDEYIEALLIAGMPEKAKQVLTENRPYIVGLKDKDNFCNIYEAAILEKQNDFKNALQIANNCYGENKEQRLYLMALKMRLAYELNETSLFESYINNIRKHLSTKGKKEYSDRIINYMLAVITALSKLYKTPKHEKAKLNELRLKVEADNAINRKTYLFKKIDEKLNA